MPPPAAMHVCCESPVNARRTRRPSSPLCPASLSDGTPYVWVDFERDMIRLADDRLECLAPYQADIRRLRFTVPAGDRGDLAFTCTVGWV
ncbi:hypothetical protein J3F83DRAFT_723040 [Trichoderma novae-zelandiae]